MGRHAARSAFVHLAGDSRRQARVSSWLGVPHPVRSTPSVQHPGCHSSKFGCPSAHYLHSQLDMLLDCGILCLVSRGQEGHDLGAATTQEASNNEPGASSMQHQFVLEMASMNGPPQTSVHVHLLGPFNARWAAAVLTMWHHCTQKMQLGLCWLVQGMLAQRRTSEHVHVCACTATPSSWHQSIGRP